MRRIILTTGSCCLLLVAVCSALAQAPQPSVIIFKDGFAIKGRVKEQKDSIVDPASGATVSIPLAGGFLYLDDDVRRIYFSPSQVQEVLKRDPNDQKDIIKLRKLGTSNVGYALRSGFEFEAYGPWNKKWEREIPTSTPQGRIHIEQRLTVLTPEYMRVDSLRYNWIPYYKTQEYSPEVVISLLESYYATKKEMTELERRFQIARFLVQAGWHDHARKELAKIEKDYPDLKSTVEPLQASLKKTRASIAQEVIERAFKTGQYKQGQQYIDQFFHEALEKVADPRVVLKIEELRGKIESAFAKQKQATLFLQNLPKEVMSHQKEFFQEAAAAILKELSVDGLGRLETLIEYALQYEREQKEKKLTTQKAEEVLSLAVTGWTQGNPLATPNVTDALLLWKTRGFLLEYQRQAAPILREKMLKAFLDEQEIKPDQVGRLLGFLPPPETPEATDPATPFTLSTDQGEALVQVPPEYNPLRSYPVLFVLHSSVEKAGDILNRWRGLAAHHGYFLVAPDWGKGLRPSYLYSEREHALVLDTLRELRKKFQIDSDRVFLFGWEEGGNMAYDVGLSHPDQFAGVMTMSATPAYFPTRYWPNAQYLPFYVVEGDLNATNAKRTRQLFKDWGRGHYPAIYCEYKGRPGELFIAEFPIMMDWMNRKKRYHPSKQLGRYHTGGGAGEEFKTMRDFDNSFYWLTIQGVAAKNTNNPPPAWDMSVVAATVQATIRTGNELELKLEKLKDDKIEAVKGVRIWNQIDVRLSGIPRATLWIGPDMIDFTKPVLLRVNGRWVGGPQQIRPSVEALLEHFCTNRDRQTLFYAKMEIEP